jgi:hypothetical protein
MRGHYGEEVKLGPGEIEDGKRTVMIDFVWSVETDRESDSSEFICDEWAEGITVDGIDLDRSDLSGDDKRQVKEWCQEYIDEHDFKLPGPDEPEHDFDL